MGKHKRGVAGRHVCGVLLLLHESCETGWPKHTACTPFSDATPLCRPCFAACFSSSLCPDLPRPAFTCSADEGIVDVKAHTVCLVGEPRELHRDATTGATTGAWWCCRCCCTVGLLCARCGCGRDWPGAQPALHRCAALWACLAVLCCLYMPVLCCHFMPVANRCYFQRGQWCTAAGLPCQSALPKACP